MLETNNFIARVGVDLEGNKQFYIHEKNQHNLQLTNNNIEFYHSACGAVNTHKEAIKIMKIFESNN